MTRPPVVDPNNKIPYLDGWRGLAIVMVLASHFGPVQLHWMGFFGVMLFFVLSGLFMSQLLFIRKTDLPTFFARRISRVVPTFYLFVGVMVIYANYFQRIPYSPSLDEVFYTLTFLRSYLPVGTSIWKTEWAIGHIWSLNVEEHSYIALACVAMLARHFKKKHILPLLLSGLTILLLFLNIYYFIHPLPKDSVYFWDWWIQTQFVALGLVASATYRVVRAAYPVQVIMRPHWTLPLLAFGIAVVCGKEYVWRGLHITLMPLCLAYVVNHLDVFPDLLKKILAFPVLRWFGQCSFSLYLWQQPYFSEVRNFDGSPVLYLALALATGAISFYFFENPIRIYLNSRWDNRFKSQVVNSQYI